MVNNANPSRMELRSGRSILESESTQKNQQAQAGRQAQCRKAVLVVQRHERCIFPGITVQQWNAMILNGDEHLGDFQPVPLGIAGPALHVIGTDSFRVLLLQGRKNCDKEEKKVPAIIVNARSGGNQLRF